MGNRDANKLRFSAELEPGLNGNDFDPYWDPKHKKYDAFLEEQKLEDGPVSTLKWILACTMGANTAFEFRRDELAHIEGKARDEVWIFSPPFFSLLLSSPLHTQPPRSYSSNEIILTHYTSTSHRLRMTTFWSPSALR